MLGLLLLAAGPAAAQTTPLAPGPYPFVHWAQDCRSMAARADRTGIPSDYIALGSDPDYCLGFGAEVRERFEHYTNEYAGFIGVPQENYLLSRVLLDTDLHVGEHIRLFTQLGREDAPDKVLLGPVDRGGFDLAQGFLDLSMATNFAGDLTLRTGRQEIGLGSLRFVNLREGPNIRAAFDGFRAFAAWPDGSRVDLILVRPVVNRPADFDDGPDPREIFGALYYTRPVDAHLHLDGYAYLTSTQNNEPESFHPPGLRNTLGLRIWGDNDPWDYDTDFVFQFGTQGPDEVRAGGVATKIGYSFLNSEAWWRPRLVLQANWLSGTTDPNSRVNNTFIPLYAGPLNYYGPAFTTYENVADIYPSLKLHPSDSLAFQFGPDFEWRASVHDAVYFVPAIPIPNTATASGRYIGTAWVAQATWAATDNLTLLTSLVQLEAGPALLNAHGKSMDYAMFETKVRF